MKNYLGLLTIVFLLGVAGIMMLSSGCKNGVLGALAGYAAGSVHGDEGKDGLPGINCWDLNGDRVNDPEEDTNEDGQYNALDCQRMSPAEEPADPVGGSDCDDGDDPPGDAGTGDGSGGSGDGSPDSSDDPSDPSTQPSTMVPVPTLPPGLNDRDPEDLPPGKGLENENANHGRGRNG